MRLLFDENLSRSLCDRLRDVFPGSEHVYFRGLERADDAVVWEYAKAHQRVIVTKDSDFHQLSFLYGPPPKVVWLRVGNSSTDMIEAVIRRNRTRILELDANFEAAILSLDRV